MGFTGVVLFVHERYLGMWPDFGKGNEAMEAITSHNGVHRSSFICARKIF